MKNESNPTLPRKLFAVSCLLVGLPFVWFYVHFGKTLRPLWHPLLQWHLRWLRYRARHWPSLRLHRDIGVIEFILLYETKASWEQLGPCVPRLDNPRSTATAVHSCVYLYWINERFDEAREAAQLWRSIVGDWIREHEADCKKARRIWRQVPSWYLQPQAQFYLAPDKAHQLSLKAIRLGGNMVKEWRDAQVAAAMLEWCKARDDVPALEAAQKLQVNLNPLPGGWDNMRFDYALASSLGMDEATFDPICKRAESFSILFTKDENNSAGLLRL